MNTRTHQDASGQTTTVPVAHTRTRTLPFTKGESVSRWCSDECRLAPGQNPFFVRMAERARRRRGGQHVSPPTDGGQPAAIEAFELERQRIIASPEVANP